MDSGKIMEIAAALDSLTNVDISGRGVVTPLFAAARRLTDKPLTLAASELLCNTIRPGDPVIITTGWVDQPLVAPGCGETDGPPGALALARALRLALRATPIIVTDECLVEGIRKVARAAGFQCVAPASLIHSVELNKLMTVSVLPFPVDHEEAKQAAANLIDSVQPAACIAIERGGINAEGMIHNMAGRETGAAMAKPDYLFRVAREKRIATIGIGDGGNEIGMANIATAVEQDVFRGMTCSCQCKSGLAPTTPVDVLVTANISNWGGYAIAALLGAMTGVDVLNSVDRELGVLRAVADAGFHDPIAGSVYPSVDGVGLEGQLAMISLLREVVARRR